MIQVKDGMRILFIGDSITDINFNRRMHYKLKGRQVYCLQVAKALKAKHKRLTFFYRGIASNRSYHVYDRLTKDCIALKPDVIVMLIGVNDAWEQYRPMDYPPLLRPFSPHMREVFRRIKEELPERKLVVMLPFLIDTLPEKVPFHPLLNDYVKELKSLAAPTADAVIDLQLAFNVAATTTENSKLAIDGVHPTSVGHKVIAQAVLQALGESI